MPEVDASFSDAVSTRLTAIEDRLRDTVVADTPFVTAAANHVISAGGKRFRPMLVVLAAHVVDASDVDAIEKAALVVELTHVASLYHDDVMDEAELRRGAQSANVRYDNTVAILVGDFLFAQASSIVADLGVEYVKLQADTFARLVQGQIAETLGPGEDDALQHYLQVVADKTGSLIATSALFGGMVGGVTGPALEALGRFGEEIGVVFQLRDDIIDITSDDTGKTPGTDLREGIPTLPTLMVQASTDPADERLQTLIAGDLSDDADLAEALRLLRAHRVIDEARAEIARRAEVARGYLSALPEGAAKDALEELCTTVVTRSA